MENVRVTKLTLAVPVTVFGHVCYTIGVTFLGCEFVSVAAKFSSLCLLSPGMMCPSSTQSCRQAARRSRSSKPAQLVWFKAAFFFPNRTHHSRFQHLAMVEERIYSLMVSLNHVSHDTTYPSDHDRKMCAKTNEMKAVHGFPPKAPYV